jgi:hypothetical protein
VAPPHKIEEAAPAEAAATIPAAPVAPVDLPEDDGEGLGLEPIAAHSQFGDAVSGQEDVAGDGSAADTIEGLVSASLLHEGAEQARSASALQDEAAPAGDEWGEAAKDVAAAPAEAAWPQLDKATPDEQGWGAPLKTDEASWAVAQPAAEVPSAWPTSTSGDGWSMEEPSTSAGWSGAEDAQAWSAEGAPAVEEPPSEALPTDAILGAVQEFAEDPQESGGAGWDADEPAAQVTAADEGAAATSGAEPQAGLEPQTEAEPAPEREDEGLRGMQADAAPETEGEPPPGMQRAPELDAEASAEPQMETAAEPQPDAPRQPREELFAASGNDDLGDPLLDAAADLPSERELARLAREPDTEPIPERPAYAVATELHEAEPPDSWGAIDDPLAAQDAPETGSEEAAVASASGEDPGAPELATADTEARAAAEPDAGSVSLEVDTSTFEAEDTAAMPLDSGEPEPSQWQGAPEEPAAPDGPVQREPTERFARQDAGWIGEALTTPLSPADLGTLASIGIEPSDGVGALRLLATLIRILNRSQLIEPDELRAEIRESREAAAAAVAQSPNGVESEGSSGGATEASESAAET